MFPAREEPSPIYPGEQTTATQVPGNNGAETPLAIGPALLEAKRPWDLNRTLKDKFLQVGSTGVECHCYCLSACSGCYSMLHD